VPARHCSIRLTRRYRAAPAEVWRALTESESLGRWLDPHFKAALEPGAVLELGPPGDGRITGSVRALEQERLLELDWEANGDVSVVRFELAADGAGTVLVLDHRLIDEPAGMAYMARWTRALDRLDTEIEP
jgi:uncharacterized protein YndB with AHSA1/START domain